MLLPKLIDVLQYKNPLVIKRFQRNHPKYKDQAEILFIDMLNYLWLCRKYDYDKLHQTNTLELNFTCVMHKEMTMIDEMWHTFILITKDYAAFCQKYFGGFVHHIPEVGDDALDIKTDVLFFQKELENFLSYVYENLGEEVVRRWFAVYLVE